MKNLYSLLSVFTFVFLLSFNSLFAQAPVVDDVNSYTTQGTKIVDGTVVVTVTFSEPVTVTGTPTITLETGSSDVVVDFTGFNEGSSGAQLNFTYTVEEGHTTAGARLDYVSTTALSGTIKSAAAPFEDATLTLATPGDSNSLSDNKNFVIDGVSPTMTIASTTSGVTDGSTTNDASIALTFTSSEATTNFVVGDISVTNGALSSFAGSGKNYTATFTATADGATTIDVIAGKFTDAYGNQNDASNTYNWIQDDTSPTGAITYSAASPYKQNATATVTATFTEALTTTPKIAISGVSSVAATNMTSTGSANIWTYAYTAPAGNGTDTFAFSVGTDAYGNVVTAAPTSGATVTVDNTAPIISAVTQVSTPSNDTTPSYVFTTDEAGTITTNI